jgi:hypothetical protein
VDIWWCEGVGGLRGGRGGQLRVLGEIPVDYLSGMMKKLKCTLDANFQGG